MRLILIKLNKIDMHLKIKVIILIIIITANVAFSQNTSIPNYTQVIPHLQDTIPSLSNYIYCSTFQMVWNEFKEKADGDIKLKPEIELTSKLNKGLEAKKYINPNDCYIASGVVTKKLVDDINSTLKKKFNNAFEPIDDNPNPNDFVFYSFLYKNLKFKEEFEKIKNGIDFTYTTTDNGTEYARVEAFGIQKFKTDNTKHVEMANQMQVYFKSEDDFIVKLLPKKSKDEIICAMIPNRGQAKQIIENIDYSTYSKVENFEGIRLVIPKFNLDITHNFNELIGSKILNNRFDNYVITEALQTIFFKLDEKGAEIKSKAKLKGYRGVSILRYTYDLTFNKPFLLMLKEKDSDYPYFVVWVANPEIMKKLIY